MGNDRRGRRGEDPPELRHMQSRKMFLCFSISPGGEGSVPKEATASVAVLFVAAVYVGSV